MTARSSLVVPRPVSPVALAVAVLLAWAGVHPALAGPTGGTVVQGQASISTPAPLRTEIRQATDRAAIDWQAFSIGAGESVRIQQPGAASVLFNRVTGGDPSLILGLLQANGRVFLSNPRGIVFGEGSQVDVGGLVATTLQPRDGLWRSDLLDLLPAPGGSGALRSAGRISAPGGTVVLAAPVLTHSGAIDARRVGLAAAGAVAVDVEGDGRIFFTLSDEGLANRLAMIGSLRADGGTAELRAAARAGVADTVLNLEGVVRARGLSQQGGRIVIDGGAAGTVRVAGTLDASGSSGSSGAGGAGAGGMGGMGGSVQVEGQRVLLPAGARVDVSGDAGGGSVKLGGGMRGEDAGVHNAALLTVAEGAQVQADARVAGDGGSVVLWSDNATRFAGAVSARGGAAGGNGGQVEVSSKGWLAFRGTVDTSAAHGHAGSLLLDPWDLVITDQVPPDVNGDGATGDDLSGPTLLASDFAGATSTISPLAIAAQSGTVSLSATHDLKVNSAVQSNAVLVLDAGNDLSINADLAATRLLLRGGQVLQATGTTLSSGNLVQIWSTARGQLAGDIDTPLLVVQGGADMQLQGLPRWTIGLAGEVDVPLVGLFAGLAKLGGGTLALKAPVSYHGTQVLEGTLRVEVDRGLDGSDAFVAPGATLWLGGSEQAIGSLTGSGAVDLMADRLRIGGSGFTSTFGGSIGGTGTLVKEGAGTVTLSGSVQTGGLELLGGTLQLQGAGPFTAGLTALRGGSLDLIDGAALFSDLDLQQGGTLSSSSGSGRVEGRVLGAAPGQQLDLSAGAGSQLTLATDVLPLDDWTVAKAGAGTVRLETSGAQQLGQLTVQAGTLQLAAGAASDARSVLLQDGSTLDLVDGTAFSVPNFATTGTATLASSGGGARLVGDVAVDGDLVVDVAADRLDLAGNLVRQGGSGNVTQRGAGELAQDGLLQTSGTLWLQSGTWTMRRTEALADVSAVQVDAPAVLSLPGSTHLRVLTGTGTVDSAAGELALGGAGDSFNFGGAVIGGATLVKEGLGTLTLSGASDHTGGTQVRAGTLQAVAVPRLQRGPLPQNGDVDVAAGALLDLRVPQQIGGLTGAGDVTSSARFMVSAQGEAVFSGRLLACPLLDIHGTGTETFSGVLNADQLFAETGVLRLAGPAVGNSFHGTLYMSGGTADLVDGASVHASLGFVRGTLDSSRGGGRFEGPQIFGITRRDIHLSAGLGSRLDLATNTLGGGSPLVSKDGPGMVGLSLSAPAQPALGALTVNEGTLELSAPAAVAAASVTLRPTTRLTLMGDTALTTPQVNVTGPATLGTAGGSNAVTGPIDVNGDLAFDVPGGTLALSGDVTDTGGLGNVTKLGPGILALPAAAVRTHGTLALQEGTLQFGAADPLPSVTGVDTRAGTTLQFAADAALQALTGAGSVVLDNGAALHLGGGGASFAFGGGIAGQGSLHKDGAGTFTFDGAGSYDSGTFVHGGTLLLGGAGSLPAGGALQVDAGARLTTDQPLQLGSLTGAGQVQVGSVLTVGLDGADSRFDGTLVGAGSLVKQGAGTFTLAGAALQGGGTQVAAGTLLTLGDERLPDGGRVQVDAGALLHLGGHETIGSLAGAGAVLADAGTTLTTGGDGSSSTLSGPLTAGTLVKQGTGVFTLANVVTLDTLDLRAGTLQLAGAAAQATATAAWLSQGATLDLANGAQLQAQQLTAFAGTLSTHSGDGRFSGRILLDDTLTLAVDGGTLTLAGDVQSGFPGAGLRKTGTGTLGLDGLLRQDGGTDVQAGRLVAQGQDHLSPASAVTVAAGAALALQGAQHVASLDADGAVALGGSLFASGDLRLAGAATVSTPNAIALAGRGIDARADANDWGVQPLSLAASAGALTLSAGRMAGGGWRDLRLQDVQAAAGGQLDGGRLRLEGTLALGGGTLLLDAHAPATYTTLLPRHLPSGVPVALADDAIGQAAGGRITTAAGSLLSLRSEGWGSITLTEAGNDWQGGLQALSGPAFGTPWAPNLQTLAGQLVSGQGRVRIAGAALAVSGQGIEADLVQLDVPSVQLDAGARIVARLPADAPPADAQAALDAAHALRLTGLQRQGDVEAGDGRAGAAQALRQPPPCDPQRVRQLRCLAPREGEPLTD